MSQIALRVAASGLDVLIAAYLVGLSLILVIGGVDLGVLQVHEPAKPVLILLLLVPVRVALGGGTWLPQLTQQATRHALGAWERLRAHISPAVLETLAAVVVIRAASLSAAFLANIIFAPAMPRGFALPFANAKFAEIFVAWDSGWYWDIATRGYYFRPDAQSSIAFFPLYPMLMRAVAAPFGGGAGATWIAGIAVSLVAYLLALAAIHQFTERVFGSRDIARRTVLFMAVFPWSVFHTRVYPESLFLLTSVLAIGRAWDGKWRQAGVWGALATLTRPNAILIAIPLVLLAAAGRPPLRTLVTRLIALAPVPAAFAGFSAYAYSLSGEPLGWMAAQSHWGYSLGHLPWQTLQQLIGDLIEHGPYGYFFISDAAPFELFHGIAALIFLGLTPLVFRRLGPAMGAYVLASLLLPLSSNALEGVGRYASVLFPVFMLAGSMTSPRQHEAIVRVSLVFQVLFACLFVTWHPIY